MRPMGSRDSNRVPAASKKALVIMRANDCSETRDGFHASFGRAEPCTQYPKKIGTNVPLKKFQARGREAPNPSPVISRERLGEGSASPLLVLVSFRAESAERRIPVFAY